MRRRGERGPERRGEGAGVGEARVEVAQRARQHADQRRRDRGDGRRVARRRAPVADGGQHVGGRGLREGRPADQHLVEDGTQRPHVGARVERLAARGGRAHVARRADDGARVGEVGAVAHRGGQRAAAHVGDARRGVVAHDGQAPVDDLDLAELADHQVGRLQVAVDDALRVRVGDGLGGPQDVAGAAAAARQRRRRVGAQELVERLAAHDAQGELQAAVGARPEVVDGHDAGVLEGGQDGGLAPQPRARHGQVGARAVDDLQRLLAPQAMVDGAHDATARALTEAPRLAEARRRVGLVAAVASARGRRVDGPRARSRSARRRGRGGGLVPVGTRHE
ncbi:MAG: hypothetical protein U1F43_06220 [Myxococcota bacterium]